MDINYLHDFMLLPFSYRNIEIIREIVGEKLESSHVYCHRLTHEESNASNENGVSS